MAAASLTPVWDAAGPLVAAMIISAVTVRIITNTATPPAHASLRDPQSIPLSQIPWPDPSEVDTFIRDPHAARGASAGLTLAAYQAGARTTARYPTRGLLGLSYTTLGLAGEAGEIANKLKKVIRDQNGHLTDDSRAALADELGDVLWYVASLAHELGVPLDDIARRNLAKLADRHRCGTITGSGDHR